MIAWFLGTGVAANLIAHRDGTAWSVVPAPCPEAKKVSACSGNSIDVNELTGVTTISGSDAWASGSEGNVNNMNSHFPYVLHGDGTAWSLAGSPAPGSACGTPDASLSRVTSPAPGTVFAVGARNIPGQRRLRTLALKTTFG